MDPNKIVVALKSRKFWAGVVGLLIVFFGNRAGVSGDTLTQAVTVIVSYIVGQGLADIKLK